MKEETIQAIQRFIADRDWGQFHSPAAFARSISIEAGELLECFQWSDTDYDLQDVKDELADVLIYCTDLAVALGLDMDQIILDKLRKQAEKYPVEAFRGTSRKYDK